MHPRTHPCAPHTPLNPPRRRLLLQVNHLAGGPIGEALAAAGLTAAAEAFRACVGRSARPPKERCYAVRVRAERARLVPWAELLAHAHAHAHAHRGSGSASGAARGAPNGSGSIDLLVADVWGATPPRLARARPAGGTAESAAIVDGYYPIVDGGISALLRAFPFESVRPSLLYYRHPAGRKETAALRDMLLARGYQTSAHWETGAWGEHNLAWRTDRCAAPGMPGRPLWWSD